MTRAEKLASEYLPIIMRDQNEPFPIRCIGYTVFTAPARSQSYRGMIHDPADFGAEAIIEYAVYYDYDIQHLYDLEHIWVAAGDGRVKACWGSFHGMRLRADRLEAFRADGPHAVLYAEPGKHAFLPDPKLFTLHDQYPLCCNTLCGGGLLIPPFLTGVLHTDAAQDERIRRYMRERFSFTPAEEYAPEALDASILAPWETLLDRIPVYVETQLRQIETN